MEEAGRVFFTRREMSVNRLSVAADKLLVMDHLTFVPTTGQFFFWVDEGTSRMDTAALRASRMDTAALRASRMDTAALRASRMDTAALRASRSDAGARLLRAGWPAAARLIGGESEVPRTEGVLIELIDALPILAGASAMDLDGAAPEVAMWAATARLALSLVVRGQVWPRLLARRPGHGDERICGWEARWHVSLTPGLRGRVAQLARTLTTAQIAVVLGRGARQLTLSHVSGLSAITDVQQAQKATAAITDVQQARKASSGYSTRGLLRWMLDACADTLVREGARRGVYVRLGRWPADAWEQRLVRGLVEDEATFTTGEDDPEVLACELRQWAEELGVTPPLLSAPPSPPSWLATESLQQIIGRMVEPTAMLASRLLLGEPAPRTLVPAVPVPTSKLNQAVAVTRALIQATQSAGAGISASKKMSSERSKKAAG